MDWNQQYPIKLDSMVERFIFFSTILSIIVMYKDTSLIYLI